MRYFVPAILTGLLLIAGAMDLADQLEDDRQYCDMVQQWEATQGRYGWPAYKGKCDQGLLR